MAQVDPVEICVCFFDLENLGGTVTRCLPPNEKLVQTLQREGIKISNFETSYNIITVTLHIYIYLFVYTYIHIFKQIKLSSSFIPHNPAIYFQLHTISVSTSAFVVSTYRPTRSWRSYGRVIICQKLLMSHALSGLV